MQQKRQLLTHITHITKALQAKALSKSAFFMNTQMNYIYVR